MSRRGPWSTANFLRLSRAVVPGVPLTIGAWAKTDNVAATMALGGLFSSGSAFQRFSLSIQLTTGLLLATAADATVTNSATSTVAIPISTWFCGMGVYVSATDRRAFVNGGGKGTSATSIITSGMDRTSIGQVDSSSPGNPWGGAGVADIGEMAIWRIDLSDADAARYATGIDARAIMREFLVAYWKLDGGGLKEVNLVNRSDDISVVGSLAFSAPPPVFMPRPKSLIRIG